MPQRTGRTSRGRRKPDAAARRGLLRANWMAHDAMWFAASLRLFGIDKANLAARAAARASAQIEAQRLGRALGLARITGPAQLRRFLREALAALRTPHMRFAVSFPAPDRMRWKAARCFWHECAGRLGVAGSFQCCVFERLDGWLEELEVRSRARPAVAGCLMHSRGACEREYRFDLGSDGARRRAPAGAG